MKFLEWLKGVFGGMFSAKTFETVLKVQPAVSTKMKTAIELWEAMYKNESPWLSDDTITSLNLASLIASEKARTATIEMEVKVTGESEEAKFIETNFKKCISAIRKNLEYGIALGGLVIKPYVTKGVDNKYKMEFDFVKATNFFPISFSASGDLREAAFIERIISKDMVYSKVEYHKLEGNVLTVMNKAFRSTNGQSQTQAYSESDLGSEIPLTEVAEWAELAPIVSIPNVDFLLFAYFKMPEANTVDLDSPLGVSGFAKAVDLIRNADEQYSNLLWEFEGGQLAIDVDRTALNPLKDKNGNPIQVLPKRQERLFRHNLDLGEDDTYNVFNPQLREASITSGLNTILMRIEDVCALSRGTLSEITISEARTATELRILKQRSYAANDDIQKALQQTLEDVVKIMDKYCWLYKIVPHGEFEVSYKWDDSIIVDKDTERQVDMLDINAGLMSRVEYRMKWFGETEVQAEEAIKRIDEEKKTALEMQQEIMMKPNDNTNNNDNGVAPTEKQAEADKNRRANESNKVTKRTQSDEDPKK